MRKIIWLSLAALLPWRYCFGLLCRHAARQTSDATTVAAWRAAHAAGLAPDREAFARRQRIYQLVDLIDVALLNLRGAGWMRRWVRHSGAAFPRQGPFLALSFHYGAGLPSMRALQGHARGVAWIYAAPTRPGGPGLTGQLDFWLARARIATVRRLGGAPGITTGGASERARAWLNSGGGIVALIDAPHYGRRHTLTLPLLNGAIALPSGLLELARATAAPIYVFTSAIDGPGPGRVLRVQGPLHGDDPQQLAAQLGHFFEEALRSDPAAWAYWGAPAQAFAATQATTPRPQ